MPVPVIPALAGVPWLASVLGGLFAAIFTFFVKYLTRRLAMIIAVVAAIGGVSAAFFTALTALMSSIAVVVPDGVSAFIGHVIPTGFTTTLSALAAAHVLRWAYDWNVKVIQMKLF